MFLINVMVPSPAYSAMDTLLIYSSEVPIAAGTLLRVPLGKGVREVLALAWGEALQAPDWALRPVSQVFDILAPLPAAWRDLVAFTARYYQRSVGEVALGALPPQLRQMDDAAIMRKFKKRLLSKPLGVQPGNPPAASDSAVFVAHSLNQDQQAAVQALSQHSSQSKPCLLFGATGSGKTEVYLQRIEALLAQDAQAQALVMVPEINLTPQLEARFVARLDRQFGVGTTVVMHSGVTPAQRLNAWLAAHLGHARLVLGTRLAIFASMPNLKLIVVDEEHDPSYKSQDGARYSARDLAVFRGKREGAQIILGSATPSLESWLHTQVPSGANVGGNAGAQGIAGSDTKQNVSARYQLITLPSRIGTSRLPKVHLIDMRGQPKGAVLGAPLLQAIEQCIMRGEQALLFLNRRGYAPVLLCGSCDWKSDCPHCSAHRVFHKFDRSLRCHHCGVTQSVPRCCPECGNLDIGTQGRGTEQLQELVIEQLAHLSGSTGDLLRVARIDADTVKGVGNLEAQLASVHAGEIDVLVGTQMVTKGHDFRRVTLVAAINPDSALFASDFRAPERLFSLLLQAAGRSGRDAALTEQSQMWVQTQHPNHPLYAALVQHDYPAFASSQLAERRMAHMPPFLYQALLRSEAKTQEAAQAFLNHAAEQASSCPGIEHVTLYPAVPMSIQRIADVERAQMLVESASRPALQTMLAAWLPLLRSSAVKGMLRWAVDVDPLSI